MAVAEDLKTPTLYFKAGVSYLMICRPRRGAFCFAMHPKKPPLEGRWRGEAATERCERRIEPAMHKRRAVTPLSQLR